jgi:hypothetical protein
MLERRAALGVERGAAALGKIAILAAIATVVAGYVWWQPPSQSTCRALTQEYNALPLSGNRKTPSLALTYYEFRLAPCYRDIMKRLDAAQAAQTEEERIYTARKADEARRKAILNGDNGPKNGMFANRAAADAHDKAYEAELARLQNAEPCKSRLQTEAEGRARFASMDTAQQRTLSDLIRKNAHDCR